MKKETIENKVAYKAPVVKAFEVKVQSTICNSLTQNNDLPDSEEEDWGVI